MRKTAILRAVWLTIFFFMSGSFGLAEATPILDQENLSTGRDLNIRNNIYTQEVIAGMSGLLSGIEIYGTFYDINFYINKGSGYQSDLPDFTTRYTSSPSNRGWHYFDVSSSNITLLAGDYFNFGLQGLLGSSYAGNFAVNWAGELDPSGYDTYPGSFYWDGSHINSYGYDISKFDIVFRTYVDPVPESGPVPIPSTLLLLGPGLLGLAGWRKFRKG